MSVAEHKRSGGPSGSRAQSAVKRAEIIELRLAGHNLDAVAERVGLSIAGVSYHEQAWLASRQPTPEITEARRQMQLASIDSVKSRLFAVLESEDEIAVQLAVVDRIEKLWNREARLVGLDLQRDVTVNLLPSAEQFAAALGWDDAGAGVIEGTAKEITDGAP